MGLRFELQQLDRQIVIRLSGFIDENSQFLKIALEPHTQQIVFDLADIKQINSMGLRNWTIWIKSLPEVSDGFCFRNCPPVVVHQMNILHGFLPARSIVESVQVPFHCHSCDHEWSDLALRGRDYHERTADVHHKIPDEIFQACAKCKANVQADIFATQYFNFLDHKK
jgi:anti-anti-sigma regulatory factor